MAIWINATMSEDDFLVCPRWSGSPSNRSRYVTSR